MEALLDNILGLIKDTTLIGICAYRVYLLFCGRNTTPIFNFMLNIINTNLMKTELRKCLSGEMFNGKNEK